MNMLTTLPDSVAALTQMKTLRFDFNKFTTLPDSIAGLTALKMLWLYGNPLAKPQSSAVEAWLAALRAGSCTVTVSMPPRGWYRHYNLTHTTISYNIYPED